MQLKEPLRPREWIKCITLESSRTLQALRLSSAGAPQACQSVSVRTHENTSPGDPSLAREAASSRPPAPTLPSPSSRTQLRYPRGVRGVRGPRPGRSRREATRGAAVGRPGRRGRTARAAERGAAGRPGPAAGACAGGGGAGASPSLPGGRRRRGPAVARENALPGHERAFQRATVAGWGQERSARRVGGGGGGRCAALRYAAAGPRG